MSPARRPYVDLDVLFLDTKTGAFTTQGEDGDDIAFSWCPAAGTGIAIAMTACPRH